MTSLRPIRVESRSLDAARELPLSVPAGIPGWSENYCLQAYDPASEVGVWLHLGLPVYDGGLWHDITIVYLPGGEELLAIKSFAPREGRDTAGPVGAMLRGEFDETSGDWTWCFHGVGHRARRDELHRALLDERLAEPLRFELRFSGLSPVWDLTPHVGAQVWATEGAHWEQPCRCEGWMEIAGQRRSFVGTGIRDHSRGRRDTTHFGPHWWLHGQFPSGRCFGLLFVTPTAGQPVHLKRGYTVYDGELMDAEVLSLPADRAFPAPFSIALRDARGVHRLEGELLHDMTFSFFAPNEILLGRDLARAERFLNEGQLRWSWDGETGYGLGERSIRLGFDRKPDSDSTAAFTGK